MADTYREVKQTVVREEGSGLVDEPVSTASTTETNILARVISLIGGIIMAILAMRFVLSLLGANRGNPFADFIYSFSYPFVAPFFGLFNYQPQFGVVRFEYETLFAIVFWAFVTWVILKLATIADRD